MVRYMSNNLEVLGLEASYAGIICGEVSNAMIVMQVVYNVKITSS